jgi:thiamine biosynthesis lipoprotein
MMATFASHDFAALGTGVTVTTLDRNALDTAVAEVRSELDAFDRACSRFRDDSDLERLNRAGAPMRVQGILHDALDYALAAAATTDGVVDPTVGTSVRLLGYDGDFASLDRSGPPVMHFERAGGWQTVAFDRESGVVSLPKGIRLDLGATAKALASDRCAERAALAIGSGVLVSVGGDVAVAGTPPDDGWTIRVAEHHAARDDAPGESIALWHGGVATSTTTVRRWLRGGEWLHHIVDPSTGHAASTAWRTVTVAASTCRAANVVSTAAIVRGPDAEGWIRSLGVPCRVVDTDGDVHHYGPWPAAAAVLHPAGTADKLGVVEP